MKPDLFTTIHNLEQEVKDIKTKQYIAGDNWILHRNSRIFVRDVTLKYKVTFNPNSSAEFIAILKMVNSNNRYTDDAIYPSPSKNGVWYIFRDVFPGAPGDQELHVFSTVPGELTVERV